MKRESKQPMCPHCGGRLVLAEPDDDESEGQLADYLGEVLTNEPNNWAICEQCGSAPC